MNKIDSIKIGNFIKALRCGLKLSQDDLAKKLCEQYLQTSAKAVSDWEKGKTLPDLDKISTLCKILGVTVDELMDGEKKKEIDFLKNTLFLIRLILIVYLRIEISICLIYIKNNIFLLLILLNHY